MIKFIIFLILNFFYVNASYAQIEMSEAVILNTAKIICLKDSIINGKKTRFTETGSGFYFNYTNKGDTLTVLVTNAHVINGCQTGYLRFKSYSIPFKINYGDLMQIKIDDFESKWIKHPSEDLAILPINTILEEVQKKYNKKIGIFKYTETDITSDLELKDLSAIEDVVMIGYPKGLSDEINDLPIVRKGFTATPVFLNYRNKSRFLIDIPIYPGSSGSPVILFNPVSYTTKDGGLNVGQRLKLLGIVVESNIYTAIGKTTPRDSIPSLEVKTVLPFNVAIVIKASQLLDFKRLLWEKQK
jgi:hypothetical protein